jgi:hypothetical protein
MGDDEAADERGDERVLLGFELLVLLGGIVGLVHSRPRSKRRVIRRSRIDVIGSSFRR